MKLRPFLKFWLPVFVWMIFIFIGSTDLMSAEHTSRFIGPFLRWFAPDISDAAIASVQFVVRKSAHLTEYAVLAALLYRGLRQSRSPLRWSGILAWLMAAISAALDEFHQSFVASRTASPWDVMVDCIGALIGLVVYGFTIRRKCSTIEIRNSKFEN
jgi:VanZ family protein